MWKDIWDGGRWWKLRLGRKYWMANWLLGLERSKTQRLNMQQNNSMWADKHSSRMKSRTIIEYKVFLNTTIERPLEKPLPRYLLYKLLPRIQRRKLIGILTRYRDIVYREEDLPRDRGHVYQFARHTVRDCIPKFHHDDHRNGQSNLNPKSCYSSNNPKDAAVNWIRIWWHCTSSFPARKHRLYTEVFPRSRDSRNYDQLCCNKSSGMT